MAVTLSTPSQSFPLHTSFGLSRRLKAIGRVIWVVLSESGRQRAARELLATARRMEHTNPALARQLREAAYFSGEY